MAPPGWVLWVASKNSGIRPLILSQSPPSTKIGPGDTTLQRMPRAPSTWAWPSVQLVTAALNAL